MRVKKLLGGISVGGGSLGLVWEFGLANIGEIYGAIIPLAFTVAPRVAWLDADTLQTVAIGLAVLLAAFKLTTVVGNAVERLR